MASHAVQPQLEITSPKSLFGHDPKLKSCIQDALKTQKDKRSGDHHSAFSSKLLLSWRGGRATGYCLRSASSLSSWQLALQSTCYPEVTAHCCLYQLTWQPSLQCLEVPAPACFLKQSIMRELSGFPVMVWLLSLAFISTLVEVLPGLLNLICLLDLKGTQSPLYPHEAVSPVCSWSVPCLDFS